MSTTSNDRCNLLKANNKIDFGWFLFATADKSQPRLTKTKREIIIPSAMQIQLNGVDIASLLILMIPKPKAMMFMGSINIKL